MFDSYVKTKKSDLIKAIVDLGADQEKTNALKKPELWEAWKQLSSSEAIVSRVQPVPPLHAMLEYEILPIGVSQIHAVYKNGVKVGQYIDYKTAKANAK